MLREVLCIILSYICESVRRIENFFALGHWTVTDYFFSSRWAWDKCFYLPSLPHFAIFVHQLVCAQPSLPASWQGWKRQLAKSQKPFADVLFRGMHAGNCAKGEVARFT